MRFDLTDLRLFVEVVEAGSITRGAERACLALASASARVQGMEAALGVPLLERGRRGVEPTPAGRALLHHARLVLQQIEHLRGELGAYAKGLKGHVRLLANTAALSEFLPDALAAFLVANPAVDIDVEERLSQEIVDAVANGLADLGVVAAVAELGALETFPFRIDRLVVVVPSGHPLAAKRRVGFEDVLRFDLVGLTQGSALQEHLAARARRIGGNLRLRVRLRSFEAVCRMVEKGIGAAIVPEAAARRCRRTMAIRIVRLREVWADRRLVICCRRFDVLPIHAQLLVEQLRQKDVRPS